VTSWNTRKDSRVALGVIDTPACGERGVRDE
jgi:hypothetical protein